MKIEQIDHIHVVVKELDRAVRFFSELLGTTFSEILSSPPEAEGGFGVKASVCNLNGVGIELIAPNDPEGLIAKTLEHRGEGIWAISVKVPNMDEAIAEAESRGLRVIRKIEVGKVKEAHIHPKDTYGIMIELCEYKAQHPGVVQLLGKGYSEYGEKS
jgi:methylmalonyl-CoA/ethylmalonyl-CoA epimerase